MAGRAHLVSGLILGLIASHTSAFLIRPTFGLRFIPPIPAVNYMFPMARMAHMARIANMARMTREQREQGPQSFIGSQLVVEEALANQRRLQQQQVLSTGHLATAQGPAVFDINGHGRFGDLAFQAANTDPRGVNYLDTRQPIIVNADDITDKTGIVAGTVQAVGNGITQQGASAVAPISYGDAAVVVG